CHKRARPHTSTVTPAIATTIVSRDASNPIHAAYNPTRRFSGTTATVDTSKTYNSKGNATALQYSCSFRRIHTSAAKHAKANRNAPPAKKTYRRPNSTN